ncbi:MAG: metallophosphoesterase [Thermodesulfobacteriota bacterium]
MRICIFSDIHGNGPAFRIAHRLIISEKADVNLFLGDLCGYYFDQRETFAMLQTIPNLISLKGNHDSIFLRIVNKDRELRQAYLKKYGNSMENLLGEEGGEIIRWLSDLPESYSCDRLGLAGYHGSPWSNLEGYVYADSPFERFCDYPAATFVLGHTHYPMSKTIEDKLIVNPGSLGQPRNGGWPSYALIDFPSRRVEFKEVRYNKGELLRRIDEFDSDNQYLKRILFG